MINITKTQKTFLGLSSLCLFYGFNQRYSIIDINLSLYDSVYQYSLRLVYFFNKINKIESTPTINTDKVLSALQFFLQNRLKTVWRQLIRVSQLDIPSEHYWISLRLWQHRSMSWWALWIRLRVRRDRLS